MKIRYISRMLAVVLVAVCATTAAQAQHGTTQRIVDLMHAAPGEEPGSPESMRRILLESGKSEEEARVIIDEYAGFQRRKLVFQIPGYSAADGDVLYYWRHFSRNSNGGGTAYPDEFGVFEANLPIFDDSRSNGSQSTADQHYFFYSFNRETREILYTMDLYDAPLDLLVSALGSTAMKATSITSRQRQLASRAGLMQVPSIEFGRIRVTLRGEQLTLDQVLDSIYEQTGCELVKEEFQIRIASCP